jgi:membrane-associated phospholipid phosphatase
MMDVAPRHLLAWPGWRHFGFALLLTALVTAWFALVFTATDHFTAQRVARIRVHLDAELQIPLVPQFMLAYMSIYLLVAAAPFTLRSRAEILRLAITQALTVFIAGVCFLLVPAQLAYPPPENLGFWQPLFHFADRLNLDYNLVPSLHVALSFVCIELFSGHATTTARILLRTWGVLIATATILTHQHHLLDAVTGWLLALAVVKYGRIDMFSRPSNLSTPPERYSA